MFAVAMVITNFMVFDLSKQFDLKDAEETINVVSTADSLNVTADGTTEVNTPPTRNGYINSSFVTNELTVCYNQNTQVHCKRIHESTPLISA